MEEKNSLLAHKLNSVEVEETLVYFATSIIEKNTEEEILWDLANNCISRLGLVDCVIYKLEKESNLLIQKAAYGNKNPRAYDLYNPIVIEVGKGITGGAGSTGNAIIVNDTSKDPRYIVDDKRRFSEIAVPIKIDNQVWGVIDCEHPEKNYFSEQHLRILNAVAAICAVKLARLEIARELSDKQKSLIRIEKELLDLRIDSVKRQMNPHFLFNALNSIQYFITSNQKEKSLKYYTIFSKLIRKYLSSLDKDTIELREEVEMLELYLKLQLLRYTDRFKYNISMDDELYNAEIPSLVVQLVIEELVEGLLISSTGSGFLNLTFRSQKGLLLFVAELKLHAAADINRNTANTYRTNLFSWEEHVDMLNKLKKLNIQKQSHVIKSEEGVTEGMEIKMMIPHY